MDDLELINFAGKAAGCEYTRKSNPLHDDALALRLAVKLRLELGLGIGDCVYAFRRHDVFGIVEEHAGSDPYAATRLAITRAAAEIGKAMP